MREPLSYETRCPNCWSVLFIRLRDAEHYWLTRTRWKCPICDKVSTTEKFQEAYEEETDVKR